MEVLPVLTMKQQASNEYHLVGPTTSLYCDTHFKHGQKSN